MDLYRDDLRMFLRSEFEKAKTNGFENIEILNDVMTGIPIEPRQFYKACFELAKEEIQYPYIIHPVFERGSTILILIQFVHNFGQLKIETAISFHSNQETK
jgi:hypothetical protein